MKKALKIVVLAKQVPDTRNVGKDAMTPEGTVNRAALPAIFNPEDLNALEMALALKDRTEGSTVHILTMGPQRAADIIRDAMFRGADGGYLLTGREFAGSDTLATSYALSCALKMIAPDIIFAGRQAIDGDTAQVGPQVAEKLGLPQVTYAEEITEIKGQMLEKADKMEELLKQVAKVLANNTNYATMISTPTYNGNKLKFIQLSQVDDHQLIVVIVMEGNIVKNQIVTLDEPLSNEALLKLNMLLNTSLNGTSLEQINLGVIARLKEQAGIHSGVMSSVLDAVANVIQLDDDMEIYTSGATNIFKYPELSDKQSAQEIISAFEEKQQLADLVTETLASEENHGIQVYIGDEAPVKTMKDCSVVTATYELGEGMKGTIGIIGPKRMDYEHVMKTLKILQGELDAIYNKEPKG